MTISRVDPYARLNPRPIPPEAYIKEETYRHTRAPVDLAVTLIPDAYTSHEFFEIERERVFAKSWVVVGFASQVEKPGQVIVAEVAGRSIIVARDKQGKLRAFHNVCRHRAAKLLDDDVRMVRNNRIRCPYHSWTYDLEGRCLGTPLFEGSDIPKEAQVAFDMSGVKAFDKADYGLLPVRVENWGFLVFVNLDTEAEPLAKQLGDLPERLSGHRLDEWRVVREKGYHVAANYKLVGENFLEYYHLPWVHPELVKVSRMEDHYRWQGPGMYSGFCTTPISQNSEAGGWQGLPPLSSLSEEDAVSARFALLFPNTAISVLPNHAFVIVAKPVGPDQTLEKTVILSHPESLEDPDAEEKLNQLMRFWDLVNLQDIEIVERVQEGISNPAYRGGRMCYKFEETLHRYQNMIVDKMVGIDQVPPGDEEGMVQMFRSGETDLA
ncbi:aromatic ring-hydroxylating dioxygenase subunit alpha [Rubrobacter taiwanensis]|uniref:Aromatic ring-hydroxylating dioxygenase subunit alpha n=1 Tax=Rubrobacter taiwanensis TaxID=185139 RepID=A0A4R1BRW8_9ACTN|nr:aromatic ring-hydroxylating dioxygenase subunit alpha [Rubrobacter taiwanensis]TCJ19965.1 aromatic ring-hydroxylating dioxygenase subunit alpha [Rubrobacter taiwanensis]